MYMTFSKTFENDVKRYTGL